MAEEAKHEALAKLHDIDGLQRSVISEFESRDRISDESLTTLQSAHKEQVQQVQLEYDASLSGAALDLGEGFMALFGGGFAAGGGCYYHAQDAAARAMEKNRGREKVFPNTFELQKEFPEGNWSGGGLR